VDSGTSAFAEVAAVKAALSEAGSEALMKRLDVGEVDTYAAACTTVEGAAICAFSSGMGDGVYDSWWGFDESGAPAALVLDFDLLTDPITEDIELTLPLSRGQVQHPELAARGVRASVPWLSPSKLRVEYHGPHSFFARWRLPDGSLDYVPTKILGNKLSELTIRPAPPGARLLLRVVTGYRQLQPVE
jgi:hypothetical protein